MKLKPLAVICALPMLCLQSFATPSFGYVNKVAPVYPESALRSGKFGTVHIEVVIAEDGSAESVSIAKSSGDRALDDAALTAAKLSTYLPPRNENGTPFKARVLAPFSFLEGDVKPLPALVPEKSSEQYAYFLNSTLPSLPCSEVAREARHFHKVTPSVSFTEMPLYQATNDLLATGSPPRALTPNQYSAALLACTKDEQLTYMGLVHALLK